MKVLYTTPILEYPSAGGPQLRIENSIKALSYECELYILYHALWPSEVNDRTDKYFSKLYNFYKTVYKYPKNSVLRLFYRAFRKIFGVRSWAEYQSIIKFAKDNNIEVIWFGYGNISYQLIRSVKKALPNVKVVCDTDSVWSRFILRELPYADEARKNLIARLGALKQAEEREWVNLCEVTTAVSEVDAQYYKSIASNQSSVKIFSNVVDIENYKTLPKRPPNFKSPCVFLAGSFGGGSAMNMATNWVLDEVMPVVWQTYPELHFYIVGRNSDREFGNRANKNITVTGMLDTVLGYLGHASVALVPLKFESGTRFKIIEAGACGVPIVSTTLGAEGLPVEHKKHILIADHAFDFAASIVTLIRDKKLASDISDNCRQLISSQYGVGALRKQAKEILRDLGDD